jgi:hypothetical protein
MSGSITYSISMGHVYQRKFATDELGRALEGYHLYCVSRRPATRIDERSILRLFSSVMFDLVILDPADRSVRERLPLRITWDIKPLTFNTYLDGSYFSVSSEEGELLHGDAWALATFILGAPKGIADQEILYVGQAYGQQGGRSAYDRTKEHGKLQRIYEEHAGEAWDIFVSPILIEHTSCGTHDHLPDDSQGFSLEAVTALAGVRHRGNMAPKISVNIVEHVLIAALQPPYNVNLLEWAPRNPTASMRKIQSWKFRLVSVILNGIDGMARYYTSTCHSRDRGQTFHFGLTETPRRPRLDPIDPVIDDFGMQMALNAMKRMAEMAEASGVVLRWFGRGAPALRKPPEVFFE